MILCGFAIVVGILTTDRIADDFNAQVARAADDLKSKVQFRTSRDNAVPRVAEPSLEDYVSGENAAIRIVTLDDLQVDATRRAPDFGPPRPEPVEVNGWRVEARPLPFGVFGEQLYLQYARPLSDVRATANRARLYLAFGVLGGTLLALLAGLATARRAMEPIAQLTTAARRIERTRDPSQKIPHPEAEDEVAELARTLESMLGALDSARAETEAALRRQREFIADASHELRTPLTSVLANLELLALELEGEEREAASSALRSSRRMRRLVADLLLLARADSGRVAPHRPVDLTEVVWDAAGELEPVAGDHKITVSGTRGVAVDGERDELHRLVLNLMENALRHTDPGTAVEASVEHTNGEVVLAVEDDGPGIPVELREKVFERFYRGSSDHGGSSGLGLSIVRAVAESHKGRVTLEEPLDGRGARFVVRLPAL